MRSIGKAKDGAATKPGKLQFKSGYRIILCRQDALLALMGKPLNLVATFTFDRPMTELGTDMHLLVGGKAIHRGSRIEVVTAAVPKDAM